MIRVTDKFRNFNVDYTNYCYAKKLNSIGVYFENVASYRYNLIVVL